MASDLLFSYISLTDEERKKFRERLWMLSPNESIPRIDNDIDTPLGTVYYGNSIYYLEDKYGVQLTGYYNEVLKLEEKDQNGAILFERVMKSRYADGNVEYNERDNETYNYEFIGEKIVTFTSNDPICDFKKSPKGYYAETGETYILISENIELSKSIVLGDDPYDHVLNKISDPEFKYCGLD